MARVVEVPAATAPPSSMRSPDGDAAGFPMTGLPAQTETTRPSDHAPQTLLPMLQTRWTELARHAIRDGQVSLAAALTDSAPVSLAGDLLTIELPATFCAQLTIRPELTQQLENLLQVLAGRRLRVLGRPRRGQAGDERTDRYRNAQDHPLVQMLLKRFEADIVAREIIPPDEWQRRTQL